ncbi:unnamed protein product [Fusarium graminearum]|uniref:Uncharacterized protein n=1 Tax=Gibberella zeae TaxID=5518 RepID=A0A679PAR0_GIBZA|nr:unnamed protein product [Fusarium graminearum]CAG1988868.1 unnamed protein product [Fusarium graminearum]CZS85239.1 unnamed protein product [Fusarium graminearum]
MCYFVQPLPDLRRRPKIKRSQGASYMDDPTPLLVLQVKFEFGRLKQSHGGISSARASPAELGLPKQQVSERTVRPPALDSRLSTMIPPAREDNKSLTSALGDHYVANRSWNDACRCPKISKSGGSD